jgi:hypothetical protein
MIKNYNTISFRLLSLLLMVLFSNISLSQTTTYTGTWDNGEPNITTAAVFMTNYTSVADIVAKSVSVSGGAQVTIASGHTFTVENDISVATNSKLIFENNSSLLQNNALSINTGNINVKRDSKPIRQFEYTYWSAPVAGQTLIGFSPLTNSSRFYTFNANPAVNNYVLENANNVMLPSGGYVIRAPDNFNTTQQVFNGEFIGIPNNGNYTASVVALDPSAFNYNLIGNPYPSAISVAKLIDNTTLGALYLWTHNTAIANNVFTNNDYAIRTRNTGTAAVSGGVIPGQYIAAGQGFFASSSTTGNIVFTNTMRVANNNSQFFKNTQTEPQFYYFRINVTNTDGAFKQFAIGYEEGATNGYDFVQDAFATPGTPLKFYSLIGTNGFTIQGRAFPWTVNDQVSLGYTSTIVGNYEIALNDSDLLFPTQDIFIEDTNSGIFHNLKTGSYSFTTAIGTFDNRFKVRYLNPTLSNNTFLIDPNTVSINSNNNQIEVNSTSEKIKSIQGYDVLGRLIFDKQNLADKTVLIEKISKQNQALIIKIKLENDQIVSKKLIF